jgi:hypothetical protein
MACMDGKYICGNITNTTIKQLEAAREQDRTATVDQEAK